MIPRGVADEDLERLARRVGKRLLESRRRLIAAESCTGGWISKAITDVAGSSAWFCEGLVTYSNEAKGERLGVPSALIARHGAVSREVARAMARGALERAAGAPEARRGALAAARSAASGGAVWASIAVAVTGIAGPDGGVPGKPVGTVWFCWAWRPAGAHRGRPGVIRLKTERHHLRGDREAVRRKTVRRALLGLLAI
ncbi:MAG TPA: CinA family protein [Steroidobacteraceae bacterium]|nr:CinA family protein [Steroidobacteraceae bacterium]